MNQTRSPIEIKSFGANGRIIRGTAANFLTDSAGGQLRKSLWVKTGGIDTRVGSVSFITGPSGSDFEIELDRADGTNADLDQILERVSETIRADTDMALSIELAKGAGSFQKSANGNGQNELFNVFLEVAPKKALGLGSVQATRAPRAFQPSPASTILPKSQTATAGMSTDKLVDGLVTSVQAYLKRCLAPIGERLADLEERMNNPDAIKEAVEIHAAKTLPGLVSSTVSAQIENSMEVICAKASMVIPPGRDGMPGLPGEPGRDGFSPEDLSIELGEDGRTVQISMTKGSRVVTKSLTLKGFPIYRGVFVSGKSYTQDDCCTYGGSVWRAIRSTAQPPKGANDSWVLMVKGAK